VLFQPNSHFGVFGLPLFQNNAIALAFRQIVNCSTNLSGVKILNVSVWLFCNTVSCFLLDDAQVLLYVKGVLGIPVFSPVAFHIATKFKSTDRC